VSASGHGDRKGAWRPLRSPCITPTLQL